MRLALLLLCAMLCGMQPDPGATGMPRLHDPSTIVRDGALYYVFSTGKGVPFFTSPDLHHWTRRGSVFTVLPQTVVQYAPGNDGLDAWAPDIVKVGKTFYLYYAVSKWGSFASAVGLATNTTLDPDDPAYKWVDRGMVVRSEGPEPLNAIDPGVMRASNGTLWMCYGSYHGTIDLVELDPKTGLRLKPEQTPSIVAEHSEASDVIEHDGWFYLFVNHGSCCKGPQSTYQINVGRSRKVTGPYVGRDGKSLIEGMGEPFLATEGEHIGPGHFGLLPDGERFSLHYEADPAANGKPGLAIRKLTWSSDGWPVAGPWD
jgi:arabinan endo-1,5-alpha-L-arabinosidase